MTIWIDESDCAEGIGTVGDVGFLVEHNPQGRATSYSLSLHPARKNMSREPVLEGWCGETNNVSVQARGLAEIVRIARNGRICLECIATTEAELDDLGYPELMP